MSQTVDCNCACPNPVITDVPGVEGAPGTNGNAGANAFSLVQVAFTVPAISGSVLVTVDDNRWMTIGQNVFVQGAGNFSVASKAGTTVASLTYLSYQGNTNAGAAIGIGAQISPSGTQPSITSPLPIANGGTAAATKAAAQLSLGVGQDATQVAVTGLTQTITNAAAIIAGATVTVPATGLYLVLARATVNYSGVTFASSRTLTFRVQNVTDTTTVATANFATQILTTATFPALGYFTPLKTAALTSGKVLELQTAFDTVNSAGTAQIAGAELIIIPLALS